IREFLLRRSCLCINALRRYGHVVPLKTELPLVDIHIAIHVVAKPERVLADETLGTFRVARLERGDDLLVIDNRPPGAVLLENRAVADSANMEEQPVRKLSDQLALAEPDDRLMKANVCIRVLAHLAGDLVRGEGVDQSVKARDLIVAGLLRC